MENDIEMEDDMDEQLILEVEFESKKDSVLFVGNRLRRIKFGRNWRNNFWLIETNCYLDTCT